MHASGHRTSVENPVNIYKEVWQETRTLGEALIEIPKGHKMPGASIWKQLPTVCTDIHGRQSRRGPRYPSVDDLNSRKARRQYRVLEDISHQDRLP